MTVTAGSFVVPVCGAIYVFDEERQEFKLRATYGMSDEMIVAITDRRIGTGDAHIGPAATER